MKHSVCMVCSGNICRSPYAEVSLRQKLSEAGLDELIEVSSGGTLNIEGQPAFVALGSEHLAPLREAVGSSSDRIWLITHPGTAPIPSDAKGITDPIGFDELPYRQTLEAIDQTLNPLTDALRAWVTGDSADL